MHHKPKVIGTGLSGLVGSRVLELLSSTFEFVNFSLETQVDILDYDNLSKAFSKHQDAVAVIHLAAFTDTNTAWQQRGDKSGSCYLLNVQGTKHILDLCQKHNKYLIQISTDFVFDGQKEGKYIETDIPHPIEWYGQTKYMAEKMVYDSNHPSSIVRLAFPYRSSFEPKKDIVRKIIDGFHSQKLYPQWIDHFTTPTFIDDIAFGLKQIIIKQPSGIFHLVASSSQSPYELCQKIANTFNCDKSLIQKSTLTQFLATQPPNSRPWQRNLSLSNDKLFTLGIIMKTIDEGLMALKVQLS